MGGFRLPKSSCAEESIDLGKYGGEGTLIVHAPRTMDSLALTNMIFELAEKDGIEVKTDKDVVELSQNRYKFQTLFFTMQSCTEAVDGDKKRPLTEEELYTLPSELVVEIMEAIGKLASFPLGQTDGKALK